MARGSRDLTQKKSHRGFAGVNRARKSRARCTPLWLPKQERQDRSLRRHPV